MERQKDKRTVIVTDIKTVTHNKDNGIQITDL